MSDTYTVEHQVAFVNPPGYESHKTATRSEAARLRLLNPAWTLRAIAQELGISRQRVHQVLQGQRLPTRRPSPALPKSPRCACGRLLSPSRKAIGLCRECDVVRVTCQQCGIERSISRFRASNKQYFCDRHCFGRWIGKHRRRPQPKPEIAAKDGYIKEYAPGHPRANRKGYVFQHILAWERNSGQKLPNTHVVHHLNGNKKDNRTSNLVALVRRRHSPFLVQHALRKRIRELEERLTQLRLGL